MENPADYDIDKDMGEDEVDEARIGKTQSIRNESKRIETIEKLIKRNYPFY